MRYDEACLKLDYELESLLKNLYNSRKCWRAAYTITTLWSVYIIIGIYVPAIQLITDVSLAYISAGIPFIAAIIFYLLSNSTTHDITTVILALHQQSITGIVSKRVNLSTEVQRIEAGLVRTNKKLDEITKERAEKVQTEKSVFACLSVYYRERAEKERAEKERAEKERAEKERAEKARAEKEQASIDHVIRNMGMVTKIPGSSLASMVVDYIRKESKRRIDEESAEKEHAEKERAVQCPAIAEVYLLSDYPTTTSTCLGNIGGASHQKPKSKFVYRGEDGNTVEVPKSVAVLLSNGCTELAMKRLKMLAII